MASRPAETGREPMAAGVRSWSRRLLSAMRRRGISPAAAHNSAVLPEDPLATGYWSRAFEELRQAAGPDRWGDDPVAAIIRFRRGESPE